MKWIGAQIEVQNRKESCDSQAGGPHGSASAVPSAGYPGGQSGSIVAKGLVECYQCPIKQKQIESLEENLKDARKDLAAAKSEVDEARHEVNESRTTQHDNDVKLEEHLTRIDRRNQRIEQLEQELSARAPPGGRVAGAVRDQSHDSASSARRVKFSVGRDASRPPSRGVLIPG